MYTLEFGELQECNQKRVTDFGHTLEEWSLTDWATALSGESGEVCGVIKKLRRGDYDKLPVDQFGENSVEMGKQMQDLSDELADVVIYADLLAQRAGIDLAQAVSAKFNRKSKEIGSKVFIRETRI